MVFGLENAEVIFDYLLYTKYVDGTGGAFEGSFSIRFDQWDEILRLFLSDTGVLIYGMGVGAYGVWLGGDPNVGSHNLFLDHLLASGFLGVLSLVCSVCMSIFFAVRRGLGDIVFCIFVFILLAFREYSISYLYVTSMGGLIFVLISYLIARSDSISSNTEVVTKIIKLGSRKVLSVKTP